MREERIAGIAAIAGVAIFVSSVSVLHVVQPELSPRDEAVSYYVHGANGWLLRLGLLSLGLGSLSLVMGLITGIRGPRATAGLWLVATWAVCVVLGGIFCADPAGNWNQPSSLSGLIHGNAAMLGFLALPIGALCLARSVRSDPRWAGDARTIVALAFASLIALVLFAASLVPVFVRPGPPILFGLSERVLLAIYALWLAVVGLGLVKHNPKAVYPA